MQRDFLQLKEKPSPDVLSDARFGDLMSACGPFEKNPHIAVGVSGGADSMCLALLLARWLEEVGGQATALTVDHGLRPESADEACKVGRIMSAHGIHHEILKWRSTESLSGNIQAKAREARYRLLSKWCKDHGVLHLSLAHNLGDQSETVAYRLSKGSGVIGLAAMGGTAQRAGIRILRPLLKVKRSCIISYLDDAGVRWIEDPSNQNGRFARVAIRQWLERSSRLHGRDVAKYFVDLAEDAGTARQTIEAALARIVAETVDIRPTGYAWLKPDLMHDVPDALAVTALGQVLRTISGGEFRPNRRGCQRLLEAMRVTALSNYTERGAKGARGHTLAGCRLLQHGGKWLVCREESAMGGPVDLNIEDWSVWDRRYLVSVSSPNGRRFRVGAIGTDWPKLRRHLKSLGKVNIPNPVGPTLPAVYDLDGIAAVPHLSLSRLTNENGGEFRVKFSPPVPLAGSIFGTG